ncbi:MAG: hypothetical protein KAQ69_12285 [Spirochaetales bacterium]|nr:hypothetical protein [Spirochaetales bacterium]
MNNDLRIETDLLGDIKLLSKALYGAQTQRAILNFPVTSEKTIGDYTCLIYGLIKIKQASARVNGDNGFMPINITKAIIEASETVLQGHLFNQFPIHFLHGGGGTSANMNANEVLANLSEEILGGKRGQYKQVHPNDHVNLHQSTNDVYPTACHIAIIRKWPQLRDSLQRLSQTFTERAEELKQQPRIARTCLQDAVEITFGDLLSGYAAFVIRAGKRTETAVNNLHTINLGGTIVGRKMDVPETYLKNIVPALIEVTGDTEYRQADNLFDAAQNSDDLAAVSSQLNLLARGLVKIAKDFRFMGSGPETGLGEIRLPAVQPGSSIMPGKINPVIPEFLIQICFQVTGNCMASGQALAHGELDLNIWESSMVFNILESIDLLSKGIQVFEEKCVHGFKVAEDKNNKNADSIIPLLTKLMQKYGYSKISSVCKKAADDPVELRRLLRKYEFIL